MTKEDDESTSSTTNIARQRFEEERRRSRLYGSNARRVKAGSERKKKNACRSRSSSKPPETSPTGAYTGGTCIEGSPSPQSSTKKDLHVLRSNCHEKSRQDELAKPRVWAQTKKFVDPAKATCVQPLPWHVGYTNAATTSGSPSAQAARYGPEGAFNLRIQCADRVSRHSGKLEAILRGDDTHNVKQYNSISNVWNEPLRLGGEDHLHSTPKMWGSSTNSTFSTETDNQLPHRLKKSLDRDTDLWEKMAASVRKERHERIKKSVKGSHTGMRDPNAARSTARSTAFITQRNQWGRTSSRQSQSVFCLR